MTSQIIFPVCIDALSVDELILLFHFLLMEVNIYEAIRSLQAEVNSLKQRNEEIKKLKI